MLGAAETIGLDDAFRIFTDNAAVHQGHRAEVGSIEHGMNAHLIVLDRTRGKMAPTATHDTRIKMTFIDGEPV